MGLRRAASVPLQLCSDDKDGGLVEGKAGGGVREEETAITALGLGLVLSRAAAAATTPTTLSETVPKKKKTVRRTTRIAAETAAAATKPLRERGLSGRTTRLSKKGVLAAASASGAELKVPVAAEPPQDPQLGVGGDQANTAVDAVAEPGADGMAPALTEPTAVPTAATTKTDSSSPQPEIFTVGESGGFSPPSDRQSPMAGDAENASMGTNDHQQAQVKAPKRPKKDEFPLKELRSTRRRSNLNQTLPASPTTNGKASAKQQQRWSSGGSNGGTLKGGRGATEIHTEAVAKENSESVNKEAEREAEPSSRSPEEVEGVVVNNNNYLDKNRVPFVTNNNNNSAVKDERPVEETTNGPESNSVPPPVITPTTLEENAPGVPVEQHEWIKPSTKEVLVDSVDQAITNDALLEQLVLTTPTKKLTEQLCMVIKEAAALEQQEQQQQQQELSSSNPSSQTLKENAEMEQMLGDLAATSELDLLQVFKGFDNVPVTDDVGNGPEGNLLSLLVTDDDDVDMLMNASPEKVNQRSPAKASSTCQVNDLDREAQEQELDMQERKKMLAEMEQELSQMQRRRDFLLRRLRKQQVHHMGRHISEEVVGLFELSARANNIQTKAAGADNRSYNKIKYLKTNARTVDGVSVVTSSPADDVVATASSQAGAATEQDVEELTPTSIVIRTDSPPLSALATELQARNQTAVGHHPFIKPPSPRSIRAFVKKVVTETQQRPQPQQTVNAAAATTIQVANKNAAVPVANKSRPNLLHFNSHPSTLDDGHRLQLSSNVGLLKTELRIVERAIDSEATASSSGGESADELINYSNTVQESLAIANRAAWRWAQERARLAARWNWLTAEISDLEYRIRQHTDLHNQLRRNKGPVLLLRPTEGQEKEPAGTSGTTTSSASLPGSVNGYRGVLPGQYSNTKAFDTQPGMDGFMADVENEVEGTSSRTRPYNRAAFKKRKLVQTMNLHTISKKAARPSSIKCGCQWPQQPCALCTGRSDPTVPRPLPDMIPRGHRAALLDPGFHPCLSFPDEISQSIRCEAVMADPQWQHKVQKTNKWALKSSIVAAAVAAGGTYKSHKLTKKDDLKKAGKKYTQGLLNRYKKSKNKNRGTHSKYVHLLKQQKSRMTALKAGLATPLSAVHGGGAYASGSMDVGEYESGVARSRNASPTHHYYRQDRIERRSRNSYDIDNIVIPYSVAASTRVEILPYKEIPTPKWKLVDETDLDEDIQVETNQYQHHQQQAASSDSNSSTITALEFDSEEYLEDYIQEKHLRALLEERKKFSTFLKFPYSTRSRANRRIDSRAESSGANTPDPASPAPHTPSIGGDHESIPSPLCPSTPAPESVLESETSSQGPLCTATVSTPANRIANNERRRTISMKMLSHQNSTASDAGAGRQRSQTPEPSGPPFETLLYPLSDRKYEEMLKQMPLNHERLDEIVDQDVEAGASSDGQGVAPANKDPLEVPKSWDPAMELAESNVIVAVDGEKAMIDGDSDTDSIESVPQEDPNDPEWVRS